MGSNPTRAGRVALPVVGYLIAVAALIGYAVASGSHRFVATGDTYPGLLTACAEPIGYFTATLAGAICLGGLAYIVTTARPDTNGLIDPPAYRVHLVLERVSLVWVAAAAIMVVVQAANNSGASAVRLITSGTVGDAIAASEMSRAWIATTLFAAAVAITLRFTVRWVAMCVLLLPSLIGVLALPVNGNASQGPSHDYATSSMIVFAVAVAVLSGMKIAAAISPPSADLQRRLTLLTTVCAAVALVYGAMLLPLLLGSGGLTGDGYGRLAIVAALALGATLVLDVVALRRGTGGSSAVVLLVITALAALSAMAVQTAPRFLEHQFTTWDIFLGYELPDPPNVIRILTVWRLDTFIGVGALVLAAAYLYAYLRLRRRGDEWPVGRLVAWLIGCAALFFTSSSGMKAYGSAMFSVHMGEHMTLNMFIPVLLVLGGPVTLALRALPPAGEGAPPGPREWVLRLVHSKVTAFISHPVVAFVLFVASLYIVYFTPIFNTLVRYHWGHELMSVHFLLVGYLFYWGIIGIDPGPKRLPFLGRLGLLFAVMPFHAFFGIATMTMTSTIGGPFYRFVDLPWLHSINADQHLGGAIAWGSSELPVIVVVIALVSQWARQDRRAAVRTDRHADASYGDDDLDAYNAMLRELAQGRGPRQ
ncbi:cytochrome c oxidase assembly protein [Mycobacterium sp. OTB74]|uniref:cytochrome c oxidase assembly protein n=1 Tax=Mycobacterium sp. OTB74 TaxID=1853452 RepID=UPI002476D8CF|nr:cytochrome c oxidase assembly protein [Mycobacterium sp. OTB74]MDH6245950.1 cytochrome c oxidase assembly factor CtaG/predicted secreted protein [Mycobacterium sp. OTB74]